MNERRDFKGPSLREALALVFVLALVGTAAFALVKMGAA